MHQTLVNRNRLRPAGFAVVSLGRRGSVGGRTGLLIHPAFDWIIGKVESKQTREKTAQERDWVLAELFEDRRQFIYEHTESLYAAPEIVSSGIVARPNVFGGYWGRGSASYIRRFARSHLHEL